MTIKHYHTATGRRLFRGARPTHRGKLAAARPFRPGVAAPPSYCWIFPAKMNMQGNSQYGDCVSAEEAQNKCVGGIYIEEQTTVSWAQKNGDLNGANLEPVIQQMENAGMAQDDNVYGDGSALAVDFTDAPTMQSAIYQALLEGGQIKMGIAADQLPAGGRQYEWVDTGRREPRLKRGPLHRDLWIRHDCRVRAGHTAGIRDHRHDTEWPGSGYSGIRDVYMVHHRLARRAVDDPHIGRGLDPDTLDGDPRDRNSYARPSHGGAADADTHASTSTSANPDSGADSNPDPDRPVQQAHRTRHGGSTGVPHGAASAPISGPGRDPG